MILRTVTAGAFFLASMVFAQECVAQSTPADVLGYSLGQIESVTFQIFKCTDLETQVAGLCYRRHNDVGTEFCFFFSGHDVLFLYITYPDGHFRKVLLRQVGI
jgi:hypothetical protein